MIQSLSPGVKRFLATESLYGLSIGMFNLLLNLHLIERGVSEKQVGLITSLGILIMGLFAIPVSILAQKTGRKKLLVAGVAAIAAGCSLFAISNSFPLFVVSQLVVSMGLTLVETTEIQLLFSYSKSKREETVAYSFMFAMFTAFTGVGTLLAGFLSERIDHSGHGYQHTLLVTTGVFLILALARGSLLPAEVSVPPEPTENQKLKQHVSSNLKKKLLWFAIFTFVTGAATSCLAPYLNLFAKLRYGFSNEQVSVLLALNGLALFIGSLFSPFLIERFGMKRTFFYIYLLNMILCGWLFLNIQPYFFSVLLVARGGVFTMLTNLVDSLSMSSFEDEERDLYAGTRTVFRSAGSALAAFAIGGIMAAANYTLPFLISGLLLLAGYLYFISVISPKYFETELKLYGTAHEM
jgi:DHA1 family multidrug resistance protein-like MFS transporter